MPINISYNGKPWLNAESTPNYTPQYEDEKYKFPSLFTLSEQDRQDRRNQGLEREIPNPNYLGLEVKYDDFIV